MEKSKEFAAFIKLVQAMREAQMNYFACRAPSHLNKAKKLEREVDAAIKEALAVKQAPQRRLL